MIDTIIFILFMLCFFVFGFICGMYSGDRLILPKDAPRDAIAEVFKLFRMGGKGREFKWVHEDNEQKAVAHWRFYSEGEDHDPDSGMSPLVHVICRLLFHRQKEIDK